LRAIGEAIDNKETHLRMAEGGMVAVKRIIQTIIQGTTNEESAKDGMRLILREEEGRRPLGSEETVSFVFQGEECVFANKEIPEIFNSE
jgi:hypothetical protein